MEIQPKEPTARGSAEWFTGDVWIDGIARGEEPSRARVSAVRFTPSARTAWHSHGVGQTLYVTEGSLKPPPEMSGETTSPTTSTTAADRVGSAGHWVAATPGAGQPLRCKV